MEIREVNHTEFDRVFSVPNHIYNKAEFNEFNKGKVEVLRCFSFSNGNKTKLGIVGGIRGRKFLSPFSAPFGGWCYTDKIELKDLENAYDALESWLSSGGVKEISITMPPFFYGESESSLMANVSFRKGYSITNVDLNFHFDLKKADENYLQNIAYNARKNYNIGEREGLFFYKVTEPEKIKQAYDIISENRKQRGYSLKMSFTDILNTAKIIDADFFIVSDKAQNNIAAAIVFKVTEKIVQVIYWGHLANYASSKPINFLSCKLFEHYKEEGMKYIDVGPSTTDSVPNYGLIEFKESIGCDISQKITFQKKIMA